eukprot:TRINITY_DN45726_c0_g1_i1.p1 TRINITY_DN45726_c0_g1~~TRINITY_DN45726_c0_g1_i1.p1  ORF type:complete len:649 (-),score=76.28 TRINITY_DN45726_c0_g1_i1:119-1990(-)
MVYYVLSRFHAEAGSHDTFDEVSLLQRELAIYADPCEASPAATSGRASGSSSSFTASQEKCISDYIDAAETAYPGSADHLQKRRWGGAGSPLRESREPPILGVGFGTTGAERIVLFSHLLGLTSRPLAEDSNFWQSLSNASALGRTPAGDTSTSRKECVALLNEVNFTVPLVEEVEMFIDTPVAEHFLDFYALSTSSKVVMTTRPSLQWVDATLALDAENDVPMLSPCGLKLAAVKREVAAQLKDSYETLVRCMVPPDNLLEVDVFNSTGPSTLRIANFLGKGAQLGGEIPLPRVPDPEYEHGKKRLGVCITGQIGRLELQSKVDNLVSPALENNMIVNVALVIDARGDTLFVHSTPGSSSSDGFQIQETGKYKTFHDTIGLFSEQVGVIYDWFVPQDIEIDSRYERALDTSIDSKTRARSHVRQWQAFHRCWDVLENPRFSMDYMVRVRDDLVLYSKFVPAGSIPRVVTPACQKWFGLNDKFAFVVGRRAIQAYLQGPLDNMLHRVDDIFEMQRLRNGPRMNPESVLWNTAALISLPVTQLLPSELTAIVPFETVRNGSTYECLRYGMLECLTWEQADKVHLVPGKFNVEFPQKEQSGHCLPESVSFRDLFQAAPLAQTHTT